MKPDKITCKKENTQSHVLAKPTSPALQQLQSDFEGFAQENSLQSEDDVVALVKEIRAGRKQNDANHA